MEANRFGLVRIHDIWHRNLLLQEYNRGGLRYIITEPLEAYLPNANIKRKSFL
jgi:hypothetical protein